MQNNKQTSKKPTFYKSDLVKMELQVSMGFDRFGNLFYYVEHDGDYCRFAKMESALDYIHSNF